MGVRSKITFSKVLISFILLVAALTMLVPILNIFAKSLSDPSEVYRLKGYNVLPKGFSLINFQVIFKNSVVWTSLFNSLFITIVGTLINVILTASAAYVMTRPGLIGKKVLMIFFIVMMIFEPGLIQEYIVMKDLKLLDNIWSMVLYRSVNVYYLILLMRFFTEMPNAFVEAAKIDGAGHLSIFFRVVMPLNKIPTLMVGMFYAVARWNEFFKSSIFLVSQKNTVLQVFMRQFIVEGDSTAIMGIGDLMANNSVAQLDNASLQAATIVIAMIPILLLYPVILKYYTSGVLTGGVKE